MIASEGGVTGGKAGANAEVAEVAEAEERAVALAKEVNSLEAELAEARAVLDDKEATASQKRLAKKEVAVTKQNLSAKKAELSAANAELQGKKTEHVGGSNSAGKVSGSTPGGSKAGVGSAQSRDAKGTGADEGRSDGGSSSTNSLGIILPVVVAAIVLIIVAAVVAWAMTRRAADVPVRDASDHHGFDNPLYDTCPAAFAGADSMAPAPAAPGYMDIAPLPSTGATQADDEEEV